MHYRKMVDISRQKCKRNGIETIIDNDGILWLNEKRIEERLDHNNLRKIATKHNSNNRKRGYELAEEPKKQVTRIAEQNQVINLEQD